MIILVQIFSGFLRTRADKPPKLVLISFGGLRWDYLDNINNLQNFKLLKSISSYPDCVTNDFISESLPSQWSMVTGVYLLFLFLSN